MAMIVHVPDCRFVREQANRIDNSHRCRKPFTVIAAPACADEAKSIDDERDNRRERLLVLEVGRVQCSSIQAPRPRYAGIFIDDRLEPWPIREGRGVRLQRRSEDRKYGAASLDQ